MGYGRRILVGAVNAAMIEAQQRILDERPGTPAIDIRIDAAPLLARRITADRLREERADAASPRRARA